MRSIVVGIVIGSVVGVMIGTTVIAPRLEQRHIDTVMPPEEPAAPVPLTNDLPPAGPEKPVVRWRMASAYSGSLPQLGSLAKRVGQKVWEVSDGGIEVKFFDPGTLVPTNDMFGAVASGTIDAAFSSPGVWKKKEPALQLFSAVPFGPDPGEYLAWLYFGGGHDLLNELYHPHGIHSLVCGMIAPEASGWYRHTFKTSEDLKGLKIRISGLGSKVLRKLGASPVELEEADIFMAFESAQIDAAEFSMPAIDLKLGFNQLADNYYFPGWHQPSSFFELLINKDKWDALSRIRKSQLETVCGDNVRYGLAEGEALQYEALKNLTAKGVHIHRWPEPILSALKEAWAKVAAEESSADSKFRKVWRSLSDFRRNYTVWKELARP